MKDLSIISLCQLLSNFTQNRCTFIENSGACRCPHDLLKISSPPTISPTNEITSSEMFLIFFVLALWLSAIGFCLNQYKSLRRLETQVHYCVSRKDPLNIGEIKIVAREQDSIIYQKKRYSTALDPQIDANRLRAMHYVHHYLPKTGLKAIPSAVSILVTNRENDHLDQVKFYQANDISVSSNSQSSRPRESVDEQSISDMNADLSSKFPYRRVPSIEKQKRTHMSIGLTVPNVTGTSGRRSSRSASNMYGNSRSAQHLCVPLCSLKSNRYSAGNISLPVPTGTPKISDDRDEQLLDPRLIPESVRRSLLALHRESHENMSMQKSREKTQSENDVNGAFYPWKTKMKSTMKRTPYRYRSTRPDTSVVLVSTMRNQSSEQDSRSVQWPQSDVASRSFSETTSPNDRRSLKHYQAYSTQSTSESESTQTEHTQNTTNHFVSQNFSCDDDQTKYLGESNEKHVPKTS